MLQWTLDSLRFPKSGHSGDEYEDAFSQAETEDISGGKRLRLAIADGATESSFSKEWAELLTTHFCQKMLHRKHIHQWLAEVAQQWTDAVSGRELPWYAAHKLDQGAFAAFLGCDLDLQKGILRSIAVGDCCQFLIRNETLISSFPLENSADFGNTPFLLSSRTESNKGLREHVHVLVHQLQPGDRIILATDALACWFLAEIEKEEKPWLELENLLSRSQESQLGWLENLRKEKRIRNDDTTFALLQIT
jgi:hypothetical protein